MNPPRLTTRTPGSPNSANPQSPVGSPHLHEYPPVASREPQADAVSSGLTQTYHAHIPRRRPCPQPRLCLLVPTAKSRGERYIGQRTEIVKCRKDNCTSLALALQGHTRP